jgi:hypothetical protein
MAGDSTGAMLLMSVLPRLKHQGNPLPRCAVLLRATDALRQAGQFIRDRGR